MRRPGDLVEVDTLDVRPVPGVLVKQFTGRDVVSRWDVVEAHRHATARTAEQFLDSVAARMPFAVRAIQVDGAVSLPGRSRRRVSGGGSACLSCRPDRRS